MREIRRRKIPKIPLADKKRIEEFTGFSQATLRNWRTRGEHSELFFSLNGKFFFNAQAFERWERKAVRDSMKQAKRMQKMMD